MIFVSLRQLSPRQKSILLLTLSLISIGGVASSSQPTFTHITSDLSNDFSGWIDGSGYPVGTTYCEGTILGGSRVNIRGKTMEKSFHLPQ